jgi:hypothetical protein
MPSRGRSSVLDFKPPVNTWNLKGTCISLNVVLLATWETNMQRKLIGAAVLSVMLISAAYAQNDAPAAFTGAAMSAKKNVESAEAPNRTDGA